MAGLVAWTVLLFAPTLLGSCSDDDPGTTPPTGGNGGTAATGGTGGTAGGGGSGACDPSLCPGEDTTCQFRSCAFDECSTDFALEGLPCTEDGGGYCDGQGSCVECINDGQCPVDDDCVNHACVGPGNNNGEACTGPETCDSGFCVDGVCCGTSCEGLCRACIESLSGEPDGTCTFIPAGQDPEQECGVDQLCSGQGACVGCLHQWSDGYGDGTQDQFAEAVATDSSGNVVLAGRFRGGIDFGGGALSSVGGKYDVFVAKLDPSGSELWSHGYGDGTQDQFGEAVAVDSGDHVLVAGRFRGDIDFGCGTMSSVGDKYDAFVTKLDSDGNCVWSRHHGDGTQDQYAEGLAIDSNDAVLVAGRFRGSINFGNGALSSIGGKYDVFVAKLDAAGSEIWSHGYGDGTQDQHAAGVAVDSNDAVLVTGRFKGGIDFGGGALSSVGDKYDVFVAKLDSSGDEVWSSGHGDGTQDQFAGGVAVDSGGHVLLVGRFRGSIDFGGGALTSAGGRRDIYLAKLTSGGNEVWSHGYGDGTQDQFGEAVAVDGADNVIITGRLRSNVDFGGGPLSSVGGKRDIYYAKLDAAGQHLCSQSYGDGIEDQFGEAVAVDGGDYMLLTGRFQGSIDFGGGAVASAAADRTDVFALKLSP